MSQDPSSNPPQNRPIRRAAFLVLPHAGGTYSVFTSLRLALVPLGIHLEWIGLCNYVDDLAKDPIYIAEKDRGHLIDTRHLSDAQAGAAARDFILQNNYDLVFVNVLTKPMEMSLPANLPPEIRRVMIVHNISVGTYKAARAVAPYVHASVAVCPRPHRYLVDSIGIPENRAFCVPNALDTRLYQNIQRTESPDTLRLLFLGRINDIDKGVFWLPAIMQKLADLPLKLTVAGNGPDLQRLKELSQPLQDRITFLGTVQSPDVPQLAASHDICIMPSRFEGFGYCLIEAMAAGCVPVASRIKGVTDYVVQENKTGLLFPIGNVSAAAASIRRLHRQPEFRRQCQITGRQDVERRFSIQAMTAGYDRVLQSLENPAALPAIRTDPSFNVLNFGGAWRRFIPLRVKNALRNRLMG